MRYLLGASLIDFQCFAERQVLLLDHLTILAGPNNSGKSAALNALRRLVSVDLHRHAPKAHPAGAAFLGPDTYLTINPADRRDLADRTALELWIGSDVHDRVPNEGTAVTLPIDVLATFSGNSAVSVRVLSEDSPWGGEQAGEREVQPLAAAALERLEKLPIVVIPEHRSVLAGAQTGVSSVREELVEPSSLGTQLLTWFCEDRSRFEEWQDVACEILGARVVVHLTPSKPSAMSVAIDTAPLRPLAQVGAGTAEVMNVARALVQFRGGLLLYEEPELHLHPRVQRRLMSKLHRASTAAAWQTIITTHSNHVLDFACSDSVAVYVVNRAGDRTRLVDASALSERSLVIEALGARPSSLLQANAVVWVEGPSDAIYLRHFVALAAAEAGVELPLEFVDFTFAFFGGALLHHTSAGIAPVPELVHLLSVHPNSFVVVDSDRVNAGAPLGKCYTARFLEDAAPDRVWVSAGREMENYLADEVLLWAANGSTNVASHQHHIDAVDRAHGVFVDQVRDVRVALGRQRAAHDASDGNKADFARETVAAMQAEPSIKWLARLDLAERLEQLLGFVRRCGGAS